MAGDFSGNGILDLAVANANDGDVSILMGNGDGTFRPAVNYPVGLTPDAIVAGDFGGDGILDLAVANDGSNDVSILMGNGDGTFQPQEYVPLPDGSPSCAIIAGDFNGSGKLDLALASAAAPGNDDNGIFILLGDGLGTFLGQSPVQTWGIYGMATGDFNGDGRLDVALANSNTGEVSILLGNGNGTFQAGETISVGDLVPNYGTTIIAGDFNDDGRLDLAVLVGNDVAILMGNGDGTFQAPVDYPVGQGPYALLSGDFGGDGILDLVVADTAGTQILLGNGDGTFQPATTIAGVGGPLAAGDFSGNGNLDLAIAGDDGVTILMGNGDGTFQPAVSYDLDDTPAGIVVGDFSGNGILDLAVVGPAVFSLSDNVAILMGNGDGTFQAPVYYRIDDGLNLNSPIEIASGDFSGNNILDLAVMGPFGLEILMGNGDGTFQPASVVEDSYPGYPAAIGAGELGGNGLSDLVLAGVLNQGAMVLMSNGDGTFSSPAVSATAPTANPVVADVNGDGTSDVLVLDGSGDILYRQGITGQPGSFEPPITVNPGRPSRDIAWVPDTTEGPLLASVDAQDDSVSLYAYRDGAFTLVGSLATGQLPAQIIAADLDGTGWDDLVVRNAGDGTLSIFDNTGTGSAGTASDGPFLPAMTVPVGLVVSDVEAVDTSGDGHLDLVVTNELTGQVSVLRNLGDGTFASPVPYRAGTGLVEVDPGSSPEVSSLDATSGVAAGSLVPGGPTELVTVNPGNQTLEVLANQGGGRLANPTAIQMAAPGTIVRMGDFTGDGTDDVAVLSASGLSIYLANGQGGFLPPTTYAVPPESDGLTIADLTGNGNLDLLVGDAYGDVLVLMGNGDGTFQPYREASQAVELAVADLNGNGSDDIIYADQGLDQVVVDYGAGSSVLANQSTGLLEPGAVALADLNGDGIPDLIVANSGSNNVLIYPGLGDGQFGPAINDGNGYFVGTNPVGITVADLTGSLPDLVIADEGSNQVSILLNTSQPGGAISFTAGPRLNSGGSGPVSTVVGNFTGGTNPDLLVTNSGSNDVTLLPGVGDGFFDDQDPRVYSVGSDPVASFVGNFNGNTDLVTVNAGSNDLTMISGFTGQDAVASTIDSGGVDPTTAIDFSTGGGFEDLVVGNSGDGALALFEGGPEGLDLVSVDEEPDLPDPTALSFSTLTGGAVDFYAATAGRESADLVAL